jgi:predicted nucleic acid-binding protein
VLVDTSIWVDHFRRSNHDLESLLEEGEVLTHPFVIGELACGSLAHRSEVLDLLGSLPTALVATPDETLTLIDTHRLFGTGLGWVDVNLLASARLSGHSLWTADRRLRTAAERLGLSRSG